MKKKNKIVNISLIVILVLATISIFLGVRNSIRPEQINITREEPLELDLQWLRNSGHRNLDQLYSDYNLLINGSLNNKGVFDNLLNLEAYRIFSAVNEFINTEGHTCFRLSFDDCLNTIVDNVIREIIHFNQQKNYLGIYSSLLKYNAIILIREKSFNQGTNFTINPFPLHTTLELMSVIEAEEERNKKLEDELFFNSTRSSNLRNRAIQEFNE
ncbi:hypothetical protein V6O07_02065 [Arthrospira platensis SPKY2]